MSRRTAQEAGLWGLPVGILGGLVGLGGGEFRIPILLRRFGLSARDVVPLNATISLATLSASLIFRGGALSFDPLWTNAMDVFTLLIGGLVAAFFSAGLVARLSNETLHRAIVVLLVGIGLLLLVEAMLTQGVRVPFPEAGPLRFGLSVLLGGVIGVVATLLGVAGGELLIPTLVFIHGLGVKEAGTASLAISLVVVSTGLLRYRAAGRAPTRDQLFSIGLPMAVGSVVGALVGAFLAAYAPASLLKGFLGLVLLAAAWVSSRRSDGHAPARTK